MYVLFALGFLLLSSGGEVFAQNRDTYRRDISKFRGFKRKFPDKNKYFSIGISVNAFNYFGDLAPKPSILSTDISLTKPGIGLVGSYRVGPRISLRGAFTYGRVTGDDNGKGSKNTDESIYRNIRNLSFRNDIKELSLTGVFDLFKHNRSYISRLQFTPYAFIGIAVMHHNPQGKVPDGFNGPEAGKWVDLEPLGTEGQYVEGFGVDNYSKFQIAIPLGIGVRYKLSQNFDLAFEIGYRHLFFDHLDDVGGNYIDKNRLGDNELARVMSDRSGEFIPPSVVYQSPYGENYLVTPGYGHENANGSPNKRGDSMDDDIYVVTSLQLTYVISPNTFRRSKFR